MRNCKKLYKYFTIRYDRIGIGLEARTVQRLWKRRKTSEVVAHNLSNAKYIWTSARYDMACGEGMSPNNPNHRTIFE